MWACRDFSLGKTLPQMEHLMPLGELVPSWMRLVMRSALGRPRFPESVSLSMDMLRPAAASGELTGAIDSGVAIADSGVESNPPLLGVITVVVVAPLGVFIRLPRLNLGGVEIRLAAENVRDLAAAEGVWGFSGVAWLVVKCWCT